MCTELFGVNAKNVWVPVISKKPARHSCPNVSRPDFDTTVFSLIFQNKSRKK
jgi:hypothetical protein